MKSLLLFLLLLVVGPAQAQERSVSIAIIGRNDRYDNLSRRWTRSHPMRGSPGPGWVSPIT